MPSDVRRGRRGGSDGPSTASRAPWLSQSLPGERRAFSLSHLQTPDSASLARPHSDHHVSESTLQKEMGDLSERGRQVRQGRPFPCHVAEAAVELTAIVRIMGHMHRCLALQVPGNVTRGTRRGTENDGVQRIRGRPRHGIHQRGSQCSHRYCVPRKLLCHLRGRGSTWSCEHAGPGTLGSARQLAHGAPDAPVTRRTREGVGCGREFGVSPSSRTCPRRLGWPGPTRLTSWHVTPWLSAPAGPCWSSKSQTMTTRHWTLWTRVLFPATGRVRTCSAIDCVHTGPCCFASFSFSHLIWASVPLKTASQNNNVIDDEDASRLTHEAHSNRECILNAMAAGENSRNYESAC